MLATHSEDTSGQRWLSVAEIAAHLGVKQDTIYKWVVRKHLPAHKIGRLWRFKISEIDDWVRSGSESKKSKKS